MLDSTFWDDSDIANKLTSELKLNKNIVSGIESISKSVSGNLELIGICDDEILLLVENELSTLKESVDAIELETYLSGEYDGCNAVIEIHAGAGGTESMDWADMLYRMYLRFCDKKGFKVNVVIG